MLICAAGDIHGALNRLYEDVLAFEAVLGVRFGYVLHVGDFGVWPDASRIDKATRNHDGAGDLPLWLNEKREAPRPTVFIKGNHEDFEWLDAREDGQVLPGLAYLRNGCSVDLGDHRSGSIRVAGVGGCYGPSNYRRRSGELQGYAKRHYTLDEIERLENTNGVDIVLTHDAPAGVRFEQVEGGARPIPTVLPPNIAIPGSPENSAWVQMPIPTQQSVRGDQSVKLAQELAPQRVRLSCLPAAFGVGKTKVL